MSRWTDEELRELVTSLAPLSPEARTVAGHCFMDFFGVTLAARDEPLANILAEQIAEDGGASQATVIGRGTRANIEQAALPNGAMSHALDFDDVNFGLGGHPTVPVAPAVLALASIASSTASGWSRRSPPASRPSAASANWSAARNRCYGRRTGQFPPRFS